MRWKDMSPRDHWWRADEGNEFLNRIRYDNHFEHEYHLVHGADRVGRTIQSCKEPRPEGAVQHTIRDIAVAPCGKSRCSRRLCCLPPDSLDDDNGNFSKGGEMRCPVENCSCFSTVSFDMKQV